MFCIGLCCQPPGTLFFSSLSDCIHCSFLGRREDMSWWGSQLPDTTVHIQDVFHILHFCAFWCVGFCFIPFVVCFSEVPHNFKSNENAPYFPGLLLNKKNMYIFSLISRECVYIYVCIYKSLESICIIYI